MLEPTGRRMAFTLVRGGGRTPWPRDRFGRDLPRRPVRGLRVEVQWGEQDCLFDRWSIVAASPARFRARCGRRAVERPAEYWEDWLNALGATGPMTTHAPGCQISRCVGCGTSDRRNSRATLSVVFPKFDGAHEAETE